MLFVTVNCVVWFQSVNLLSSSVWNRQRPCVCITKSNKLHMPRSALSAPLDGLGFQRFKPFVKPCKAFRRCHFWWLNYRWSNCECSRSAVSTPNLLILGLFSSARRDLQAPHYSAELRSQMLCTSKSACFQQSAYMFIERLSAENHFPQCLKF